MGYQFTPEELREVIRASRVYNPGFSDQQLQNLLLLKGRLAEEGYLEAVNGLAQLEKEGIPTARALEEYKALIRRKAELEKNISNARSMLQNLEETQVKAERELNQIKESIQQTKGELTEIGATRDREKQELAVLQQEAALEKEKLAQDIEKCRKEADITQEEVMNAGKIKGEIEAQGYSLDLFLGLAKEFSGHLDACQKLAEELKEYQTVRGCITALEKQRQDQQQTLEVERRKFDAERERWLTINRGLESSHFNLQNILSRLQADKDYEVNIRNFHRLYWKVSGLLDCLTNWDNAYFYRCHNPISAMGGFFNSKVKNAYFWTDKEVTVCPHCGFNLFHYDEKPYLSLGVPLGTPVKIELGE